MEGYTQQHGMGKLLRAGNTQHQRLQNDLHESHRRFLAPPAITPRDNQGSASRNPAVRVDRVDGGNEAQSCKSVSQYYQLDEVSLIKAKSNPMSLRRVLSTLESLEHKLKDELVRVRLEGLALRTKELETKNKLALYPRNQPGR